MGKPRMTALAVALRAIEPLSDEEKQTVRDMLRPAPKPRSKPKPERKPSQKRKTEKEAAGNTVVVGRCAMEDCGELIDANVHHVKSSPIYHEFIESAGEASKGVGA